MITKHIGDRTYTVKGGIYRRVLLRNSYRKSCKVYHNTIANFSKCSHEEITAIKFALDQKAQLAQLKIPDKTVKSRPGLTVVAVWVLSHMAKRVGI